MISSADEFVRLRRSNDPTEYSRATHEEAPEHVWLAVIENFPDLREWVAHNKTVPMSVLDVLAQDPNAGVRCAVATKRKLSAELQRKLATDVDSSVRARVAYNPKCEFELLELLAQDSDSIVRDAAETQMGKRRM